MPALLAPMPKQRFFTNANLPAAGYKLYTYTANTTNLLATYSNRAATIPNANPITLDANGECVMYLQSGQVYDFKLERPDGVQEWLREDVEADPLGRDLADPSAGKGGALVNVKRSAAARTRTLAAKVAEVISVQDYPGGDPGWDGSFYNDITAALQAAINDLPSSGGQITIPNGTYSLSDSIQITKPVTITGAGESHTLLAMRPGVNKDAFVLGDGGTTYIEQVILERLLLLGNNDNNTAGSAVKVNGVGKAVVRHCYIQQWATDGVSTVDSVSNAVGPDVHDCWINECNRYGIRLGVGSYGGNIRDNMIRVCGQPTDGAGIWVNATEEHNIVGNLLDENQFGIVLQDSTSVNVSGNYVNNTKKVGIYGTGSGTNKRHSICGNVVKGAGWLATNTYPAIEIKGTNNTVTGNSIAPGATWIPSVGIKEAAGSDFNTVVANAIEGATLPTQQAGGSSVFMANTTGASVVENILPGGLMARNLANNANLSLIRRQAAGNMIEIGNGNPNSNCVNVWMGGQNCLLTVGANDSGGAGFRMVRVANF